MSRAAGAAALVVSGALHGVAICVGLAVASPGLAVLPFIPVDLIDAAPPTRVVDARPLPPRAEPLRPVPRPRVAPPPTVPSRPEPQSPPRVIETMPATTLPEAPTPPVEATPAAPALAAPSPAVSRETSAAGAWDATGAGAVDAAAPNGQRRPEGPATSGPSLAAAPTPAATAFTRAARPRGGYQVQPSYPAEARRANAEGTTLLRVHITADGGIDDIQVERSAGHAALDQAAANAVRKWRFEPARKGSVAVAVWVVIPVQFRLERNL